MKPKFSFIATASSVLFSLTAIVAEASSSESRTISPLSPQQDSKVPASMPSTASVSSVPLQAKVIDCVGKVRWRAGADIAWKDAKDAAVEDLLSAGAEVRTGLRSRMTLKFDNATVLIDSNSNFAMPTLELVKENDGDVYRTVAQMKSGRGDFQVDKVGAKNDFKVVTPSSTLAVRGTGFSVSTGALAGTEVVGARTNAIAAIQLKYAATSQVVQMSGGGEAKSSSISPEPATAALMSSIGALPMAGTATSVAEHETSASMGTNQTTAQAQIVATVATVSAGAIEAAGGAPSFAINVDSYENFAESFAAKAFTASEDAFAFRVDADIALGSTIFAHDIALQAIGVHNEALTTVSTLFTSAGVSLAETQCQMVSAEYFSNKAYVSFLATTYNVFESVFSADASATQSEFSAAASKSAAIETRGYATEAIFLAGISQQAGLDYATALAQAEGLAANAATATSGAIDAAADASRFTQATVQFADVIGTTQSNISKEYAIAAKTEAIIQRNGALVSRDAALAAAVSARSAGERVFFTETAEIAAQTVARADQARIFADQAKLVADYARTYADNASVVALGVGTQLTVPPPNCPPGQTIPPSN